MPAKRTPVWLCVVINLLAFPGLGTVMAGRRIGYSQSVVMVMGFVLTVGYLLWYLFVAVRYMTNSGWTETEFQAHYRPYLWALYSGVGLCLVAWLWALASSIVLWRNRTAIDNRDLQ
jgi:hypothetical protein